MKYLFTVLFLSLGFVHAQVLVESLAAVDGRHQFQIQQIPSVKNVRRITLIATAIPVTLGSGAIALDSYKLRTDAAYRERNDFIPMLRILGATCIVTNLVGMPSMGSMRYKDYKRGAAGIAMRLGGLILMGKGNEFTGKRKQFFRVAGGGLVLGGSAYSILTLPLSRRSYQQKIERR